MVDRDLGEFIYRGTTLGWPGDRTSLEMGHSSTSTSPVVATLFALRCRNYGGPGVVHLLRTEDVPLSDLVNVLSELESEIVVDLTPAECESRDELTVDVDDCLRVLAQLGLSLPIRLPAHRNDLKHHLLDTPRLSRAERAEFDRLVFGASNV